MKFTSDSNQKLNSALQLLSGADISVSSFANILTLIKGIHPEIDKKLAVCSQALDKVQKLQSGDIISLSAESLPEETEEEKKRKKILLFFINSIKDLQSEIKRVKTEMSQTNSSGQSVMSWGRIIKFAKGPFGLVTALALVIVGISLLLANHKQGARPSQPVKTSAVQSGKKIQVIAYQGKQLPLSGLYIGYGPDCDSPHYHATNGQVSALDGTVIRDPEGCGFGKVKDVQVIEVTE